MGHIAYVFMPGLYDASLAENEFQLFWVGGVFNALTYGSIPVQVFFVLSGFLICKNAYENKKVVNPLREYRKLLRIVLPAVFFMAILMAFNLLFHLDIPHFNPSIVEHNNFTPTILNAISDAFFLTFVKSSLYVTPLWFIKYEFFGAILISSISFSFSSIERKSQYLCYLVVAVLFFFLSPCFVSILWGALVYVCLVEMGNVDNVFDRVLIYIKSSRIIMVLLLILGIYLASVGRDMLGIYKPISFIPVINEQLGVLRSFGVALCLFCIENKFHFIQHFLSFRFFTWLGGISAYIYAFHWPIIVSLGSYTYLKLDGYLSRLTIITIITIIVLLSTLLIAYYYTLLDSYLFKKGSVSKMMCCKNVRL